MHLNYLDESGQTGTNLRDTVQPVFVLGALIVPESVWLVLEKDLQSAIEKSFPAPRPDDFEIHATEISNPRNGYIKQHAIAHRLAFRDEWLAMSDFETLTLGSGRNKKRGGQGINRGVGKIRPTLVAMPKIRLNEPL